MGINRGDRGFLRAVAIAFVVFNDSLYIALYS